jgi:hypothetical protein
MLFLLAMEPLHRLFKKAQENNLLSKVSKGCETFRASLYADDATFFIKPTKKGMMITRYILDTFAKASGLATNMEKNPILPNPMWSAEPELPVSEQPFNS